MCHKCGSVLFPPKPLPVVLLGWWWRLYLWLLRLIKRLKRAIARAAW